ncbi:uncharacterized protein LOC143199883 [Rhynchophorus ferrugineus]|uniref:uncharacterized protein LOC143199883 n=1 Tax=Rhynchophorus ferrugineus TaxID=354439 RepID=UPI003FCDCBAA
MKWNSFLADQRLDGPPSFWRVSKCLVGKTHNVIPPLKSAVTGNFAVTDQEKVELLAETYEAQMKCLPPAQNTKTKDIDTVINESNSVKRPRLYMKEYVHLRLTYTTDGKNKHI